MEGYIKGTFKKIIFKSDNNYIIGLFKIKETNEDDLKNHIGKLITITGYFHELTIDEKYFMKGKIVNNKKYGIQYNIIEYERIKPTGKDAIIDFLSSNLFRGVGEKTAKEIVDKLGDNALKLIEEDYSNLLLVPNLKENKAKEIHDTLVKYNESYNIILYLNNIGFNTKDSLDIYNLLKEDTITIIKNNIYSLIDILPEINFIKIDKIRKNLNILDDDKNRIIYGIEYIFKNMCFSLGNTYLEIDDNLINNINRLLNLEFDKNTIEYYLIEMQKIGKIKIIDNKYFLSIYYLSEEYIARRIYHLINLKDSKYNNINNEIDSVEDYFSIKYNNLQKKAIKDSIIKNVNIITGGPGTGKTTIIKGIIEVYKRIHRLSYMDLTNEMVLLAPTGRASKRMSEATLMPAYTIHRFLKWNKNKDTFMVNELNKSDVKFVIIDETSMIDVNLFSNLLKGLRNDVKIVMIGDYNQLESVSPGNLLKDLIDSNMINVIKLEELYRQSEDSYISKLAKEINENDLDNEFYTKKSDFNFIESNNTNIKIYLEKLIKKALEKGYSSKDIQVLAPIYKGENGIDNLNKILQNIFNPNDKKDFIKYGDVIYRVDDKILKLENDPDNNIFNGDIGYIKKIIKNEITIDFDGNIVKYNIKDFNTIKHGYAISIHKSQGSEFKLVFLPISTSYKFMLYKKLIYTAVTRAKKSLTLIGSIDAFKYAINNNINERKTYLKELLLNCINH